MLKTLSFVILLTSVDIDLHLAYCHARLTLLLHISQTRFGATAVLNAGLYHSIQASGLFATDPDLGIGEAFPHFLKSLSLTT